jgi:predicted MPP superfamily phosphohydrolase
MKTRMALMFLTALLITSTSHYYLYIRLVSPLVEGNRAFWEVLFAGLWILVVLGLALVRAIPQRFRSLVELPLYLWIGVGYVFLMLSFVTLPIHALLYFLLPKPGIENLALGVLCVGGALSLWALFTVLRGEKVIETVIPLKRRLNNNVENLKIAVISDVHISGLIGKRRASRLAKKVNSLGVDIIFVTGDLVDGSVKQLRNDVQPLGQLNAPLGVHFVTGNHDYYSNATEWKAFVSEELGWNVLSNSSQILEFGELKLNLMGIEDRTWLTVTRSSRKEDPRLILATQDLRVEHTDTGLNILLAHQPKDAHLVKNFPWIDLQVSGHTHSGQLWPLHVFVYKDQTYNKGLYQIKETTNSQIYVNQGTGFWGPPLRLGTTCEISLLKFKNL